MSVQQPPREMWERFGRAIVFFIRTINAAARGLRVTALSWWRSPTHNATLAEAAVDSQHLIGLAADLQFPTEYEQGVMTARLRSRGLTVVVKPSRKAIHVQLFPASAEVVRNYAPDLVIV